MPSIRLSESIGKLTKTSTTTVQLAASRINIGGQQYVTFSPINLLLGIVGIGGLDAPAQAWKLYYVYAVASAGAVSLIASTNATAPSGFSSARLIGYFDTNTSAQINGAGTHLVGSVGDFKAAHMAESQFIDENGPGWILADGRNVAGSRWAALHGATVVPDARGMVLRGRNDGGSATGARGDGKQNPDGTLGLGVYQADANASHDHGGITGVDSPDHSHANNIYGGNFGDGPGAASWYSPFPLREIRQSYGASNRHQHSVSPQGANESRMKNITVNHFIKVN
jgi:hypothetical protein